MSDFCIDVYSPILWERWANAIERCGLESKLENIFELVQARNIFPQPRFLMDTVWTPPSHRAQENSPIVYGAQSLGNRIWSPGFKTKNPVLSCSCDFPVALAGVRWVRDRRVRHRTALTAYRMDSLINFPLQIATVVRPS